MNSRLTGIQQVLLFLASSLGFIYLFIDYDIYLVLASLVLFKISQTFGSGLAHHIWISHKQYDLKGFMKYLALFSLVLAGVNRPQFYARYHTLHHKYVDTIKDPHSPVNMKPWYLILGLWVLDAHKYDKYLNPSLDFRETNFCESI